MHIISRLAVKVSTQFVTPAPRFSLSMVLLEATCLNSSFTGHKGTEPCGHCQAGSPDLHSACVLSHVRFSVTPWTVAQTPPSVEFSRQEY